MSIQVIAQVIAIVVISGWLVYKEVAERSKARRYDLADNPERCHDHENRLRSIEGKCGEMTTTLAVVNTRLEGVEKRLDNIAVLFNTASGDHV